MDFTFNTTNSPAVHALALECLAMNGTAGFVAAPLGQFAPQMFAMLAGGRQLRGISGRRCQSADLPAAAWPNTGGRAACRLTGC